MGLFLDILSKNLQKILSDLASLKDKDFYLAGGTALALQMGHRTSEDFDFYTSKDFNPGDIFKGFQNMKNRKILLSQIKDKDRLIFEMEDISVSLFSYPYSLLKDLVDHEYLYLASIEDIAAMKLIAIIQRGTKRDFIDLYFLIKRFGLDSIFKMAEEKFPGFNAYLALQSITYFKDAELEGDDRNIKILKYFNWKDAKDSLIDEAGKTENKWKKEK